jgi:hypothetical protein
MSEALLTAPQGAVIAAESDVEPIALREELARAKAAQEILDSFWVDLYAEGSSLTDTAAQLQTKCAPSEIVLFPRGPQICVKPSGANTPLTFVVDESWGKLFAHHFRKMRAGGSRPFFDFDHRENLGISGWPKHVFWAAERGVCAIVEWTPAAAGLILAGDCTGFSPSWRHMTDVNHPFGVGLRMGALLFRSTKPALSRMPDIRAVSQASDIRQLAKRFLQFVGQWLPEFKKSKFAHLESFAAVAKDLPDAYRAHLLIEAIAKETANDTEIAYS